MSQKQCKIWPRLLWQTDRKLHMHFRLVPKSSTLDDHEQPIHTLQQQRASFRAQCKKVWMKTDSYYQQQKCRTVTVVSRNKRYMQVFTWVPQSGVSNKVGWGKQEFSSFISRYLENGMKYDQSKIWPKLLLMTMTNRKLHMCFWLAPKLMTLGDLQLL